MFALVVMNNFDLLKSISQTYAWYCLWQFGIIVKNVFASM